MAIGKGDLVFFTRFSIIIEIVVIIWKRSINEFHKRHWRRITCPKTALENPGITARSLQVPGADFRKQLAYSSFASHSRESQAPVGN
jgi:hypothetical protein